jgi:hypothetical protein
MPDRVVLAFEDREYRRSELDAYTDGLAAALPRPRNSALALGQGLAPRAEGAPWMYV